MFQEFFFEIQIEKLFAVSYQVPFQDLPLVVIVNVLFILVRLSLGVSVRRVGGLLRVEPFKKDREKIWEILINLSDLSLFSKDTLCFETWLLKQLFTAQKEFCFRVLPPPSSLLTRFRSEEKCRPQGEKRSSFFFFCKMLLVPPPSPQKKIKKKNNRGRPRPRSPPPPKKKVGLEQGKKIARKREEEVPYKGSRKSHIVKRDFPTSIPETAYKKGGKFSFHICAHIRKLGGNYDTGKKQKTQSRAAAPQNYG